MKSFINHDNRKIIVSSAEQFLKETNKENFPKKIFREKPRASFYRSRFLSDHPEIPSFDSVHCQKFEPDHSYAQLKTIETSDFCNVAFESVPDIQVHEVDDECNLNVDIDLLSTDLLPLNHCRYVVELYFIVQ